MPSKLSFSAEETHKLGVISHLIAFATLCNTNEWWTRLICVVQRRRSRLTSCPDESHGIHCHVWKVSRRDFQCPLPRRLILKTNSSHFWLDSRLKHSATLVPPFKGNEIPSVFEPYEWYFFSLCIDAWLTLFIFSSLLYFYYTSPASATNLKKAILPFKGRGLFTFLIVQICYMIL